MIVLRISPLLLASVALAASAAQDSPLDSLIRQALALNPEVLAAQKRYEAARQRPVQAAALPDPMISPEWNSSGRPWPGAGLGTEPNANIGVMLSQEIPFPGKRKLAGDIAAKEAEAEFENYQAVKLSVVSRVKQAFYRLSYAYAATGVIDRNLELLRRFLKISEVRYAVGKAEQQDILKAQTQLAILETRRVPLEQEKRAREAELNSLLNRPAPTPVPAPSQLPLPGPLPELATLLDAARENSPALRRDEKMLQRSGLAMNQARKQFYPDFTLNAGYYNMGRMPSMYMFRADIRIPLWWNKQRAAVSEQVSAAGQARASLEASSQSLTYQISNDFTLAEAALRLASLYRDTIIPQAGLTLESSLASYEAGRADFLTLLTNYMTIVEYEMNYIEQLQNGLQALARLEEMTGRRLLP